MRFEVEYREESHGPQLTGVMLQEGRAATGGRAEVFAPGSVEWPSTGIEILTVHKGPTETRGQVVRDRDNRLLLTARATPAIKEAYDAGKRYLSVEFVATRDRVTKGGVREILRAIVDKAALVERPEYDTAIAEVRSAADIERKARLWL